MKRIPLHQRSTTRRGAVLIVVLAMLALFAVIGLSFVLYAESQANMAESNKRAFNDDTPYEAFLEFQPEKSAELYLSNLIYGLNSFGDDLMNPLRGHSLAESKYGSWRPGVPGQPSLFPFAGQAVPAEPAMPGFNIPGVGLVDRRNIVNYTYRYDSGVPANSFVVDPERFYGSMATVRSGPTAPALPVPGTYVNQAVPYTYPDRQANFFLALQDQSTGEIVAPSFFRQDLFGPANLFNAPVTAQQRLAALRPTKNDHPNFPNVPQNPDGTYTGDVQNMKFLNLSQKNDSFWMDAGGPVLTIRGRKVKAMVAPLILDLSSKVNLSIAGNIRAVVPGAGPNQVPLGAQHRSHEGIGPWEINPGYVGLMGTELQSLLQRRFPNVPTMPSVGTQLNPAVLPPYTRSNLPAISGRLNDGQLPPLHAGFSPDGLTTTAGPADPMTLPAAGTPAVFPTFPGTRFPNSATVAPNPIDFATRMTLHPHLFNPLLYRRGSNNVSNTVDRPFGLDDVLVHGARVNDGKNRWRNTQFVVNPAATSLSNLPTRLMTTGFNVSQQVPMMQIPTGGGATTNLAPIDINRELPDYRKNTVLPLSPLNMWNPAVAGELPNFLKARQARQSLARDIFVRLAAYTTFNNGMTVVPAVDGVDVFYDVATGYLNMTAINVVMPTPPQTAQLTALRAQAQLAANIVDLIDHDDIATAFVWNPNTTNPFWAAMVNTPQMDPSADPANYVPTEIGYRTIYGSELPRLVLNEVYSCIANQRDDPFAPMMRAQRNLKRRYYIELHNPMPADSTRPDNGATRLKYDGTTTIMNPITMAPVLYTGPAFNPYQIEIATSAPSMPGVPTIPFSTALVQNPLVGVVDHAAIPVAGMTLQARINNFAHDATAPAPMTALAGDGFNVVQPFNPANPVQGLNNGFYVMGPRDPFTATQHSLSLADGPAGVPPPATPVNALSFDATNAAPNAGDVTTEAAKTSVVLLRRLMNPYIPYDAVLNPYITVDYLENIPTRDRVTNDSAGLHTPAGGQDTAGSQGRVHPFVAFPTYGSALTAPATLNGVNDHISTNPSAGNPFHTMFGHNEFAQNLRGMAPNTTGFEWMVHFDRKLINSIELLHVGTTSPAQVTQRFAVGNPDAATVAQYPFLYQYHTRANSNPTTMLPYLLDPVNAPNYYKLLDFLTCGNPLPGTPIGWREPGKMNFNGFTRQELFLAATDPQLGNTFTGAQSANTWLGLHGTRTPNYGTAPFIRGTTDETTTAGDRPLKALSASASYDETFLRGVPTTMPYPMPGEYMWNQQTFDKAHPYTLYEQLRKSWNNLNTVSDSFLVLLTVSFFEVENDAAYGLTTPPIIGKELYNVTPGDLRVQFGGIIDRSNLAIAKNDAAGGLLNFGATPPDAEPWSVKLVEDVHPGSNIIHVEAAPPGTTTPIAIGANQMGVMLPSGLMLPVQPVNPQFFRLGHGDAASGNGDGEPVSIYIPTVITQRMGPNPVTGAMDVPIPNQVSILLHPTLPIIQRYHAAGTPLSNAILGNPGPQTVKPSLAQLRQRQLLPYFTRINP